MWGLLVAALMVGQHPLLDPPPGFAAAPPPDLAPLLAAPPPATAFERAVGRAVADDEVVIAVLLMGDFHCQHCDDQRLVWSRAAWPDKLIPIVLEAGDKNWIEERDRQRPTGWPTTIIYWRKDGAWGEALKVTGRLPISDQEILERPDGRVERFRRPDGLTLETVLADIHRRRAATAQPADTSDAPPTDSPAAPPRTTIGEPQTVPIPPPTSRIPTSTRIVRGGDIVYTARSLDQVPHAGATWRYNHGDSGESLLDHIVAEHGLSRVKLSVLSDQDLRDLHSHAHEAERGVRWSQHVVAAWR